MEVFDLREVYSGAVQVVQRYTPSESFGNILRNLSLGDGNRANPGNRSLYTLQAFVAITIEAAEASIPNTYATLSGRIADGSAINPPSQAVQSNHGLWELVEAASSWSSDVQHHTPSSGQSETETHVADLQALVEAVSSFSSSHLGATPSSGSSDTSSVSNPYEDSQDSDSGSESTHEAEYTSTDQVNLPMHLRVKFKDSYNSTRRLANWLVEEAGRLEDVRAKYMRNTAVVTMFDNSRQQEVEFTSTWTYVELARIIERHGGSNIRYLTRAIAELAQNLRDRQVISEYYAGLNCESGSDIEVDNEKKRAFNGRLAEVLVGLRAMVTPHNAVVRST